MNLFYKQNIKFLINKTSKKGLDEFIDNTYKLKEPSYGIYKIYY